CSSYEVSKAKRSSFKIKDVPSSKGWLNLLHMDLCGPMRVASLNGKKYIMAEAIATACYTQNRSIIIPTHEKTANHISMTENIQLDTFTSLVAPVISSVMASDYENSDPAPQLQNVSPSADTTAPRQQELDLLFGPLYDEFFNAGTSSVNKSSSPTGNSKQQDTPPTTNIQSSTKLTTLTNVNAEENNNNQAEDT
ncbi:hypothetical protein Tco_1140472, partial [Tanacetum coccineum]